MQSKEPRGTASQSSDASALCCLLHSGKYSAGLSCSSSPRIWSLPPQLSKTTVFDLDSHGLCCSQEIVPRHKTSINTGFTVCASHLSGIIFLHCLFAKAFKQVFHILYSFQPEGKPSIHYSILTRSRSPNIFWKWKEQHFCRQTRHGSWGEKRGQWRFQGFWRNHN